MGRHTAVATLQMPPARAADAVRAVPLIYSSGPAAFDYVFAQAGEDARAFLMQAFVDGGGELGWRNHVVGECAGEVVAVGSGFTRADRASFTAAALRQILRHYGWRAGGMIARGLRTERVVRPPEAGDYYVGHLGVALQWRGQGLGTALVEWFIAQARRRGCPRVALDVAVDNPRAQALYERLGFRVVHERASTLHNAYGAVPAQRRMHRALAPA